eukprot:scaffold12865_cov105-Cylindrotheca_fusiformis.AAC.1
MDKFASAAIDIVFDKHVSDPSIHDSLNSNYGTFIEDTPRFFKNPLNPKINEVIDDSKLYSLIRRILSSEIIAPFATNTNDKKHIDEVMKVATLHVISNGVTRRLNRLTITAAFQEVNDGTTKGFKIRVGLNCASVDFSVPYAHSMTNWEVFKLGGPVIPNVNINSSGQQAQGGNDPAKSTQDLLKDLVETFKKAYPIPSGPTPTNVISSSSTTNPNSSPNHGPSFNRFLFNTNNLPSDVQDRYKNKMKKGLITGSMITTKYNIGNYYWFDGKDRFILADGTVFILNDMDEKGIKKLNIRCTNSTHAGIRSFYMSLERAFIGLGVYIHPFWCFRKDHGGLTGFNVGDGDDDDLPKLMEISLNRMSDIIYRFLSEKDMFPKDSNHIPLRSIVLS